jgi:hypothetical protein
VDNRSINRHAEFLGDVLLRAADGNPAWHYCAGRELARLESPADVDELLLYATVLAGTWMPRLTGADKGPPLLERVHTTESERLQPSDFTRDPSGSGRRGDFLTEEAALSHAYRQVAYWSLGLPCHPDVTRVITGVEHGPKKEG